LQLDWSQLNVDASTRPSTVSKARSPQAGRQRKSWSSNDKPNGSAALSVKQPLSPFWDAGRRRHDGRRQPATPTTQNFIGKKLAKRRRPAAISGAAWAAMTAPRRLDLGTDGDRSPDRSLEEQSKLGTSLSKSLP